MASTLTATARRLLAEARRLRPPEPPEPEEEHCPRCGHVGLMEPDQEQLLTLTDWAAEDAQAAYSELCAHRARLAWCPACARLVPAGTHDPAWLRQFWAGAESPGLRRNIRDLRLLRLIETYYQCPPDGPPATPAEQDRGDTTREETGRPGRASGDGAM